MTRTDRIRLARRPLRLLDASPLPLTDRVRLALEREALDWLAPVSEVRLRQANVRRVQDA